MFSFASGFVTYVGFRGSFLWLRGFSSLLLSVDRVVFRWMNGAVCFSRHLWVDVWVVSTWGLSRTFSHVCLFVDMHFSLGQIPRSAIAAFLYKCMFINNTLNYFLAVLFSIPTSNI